MKWFLSDLAECIGEEKSRAVLFEKQELCGYRVKDSEIRSFSLVMDREKRLTVRCDGRITILMPCDRCLSDTPVVVEFSEELKMDPETSLDEHLDPVYCFSENALDTDEFLSEAIRPYLPMQVLCSTKCKGLCPLCGKNLNRGDCSCKKSAEPTKMADALKKALLNSDSDLKID